MFRKKHLLLLLLAVLAAFSLGFMTAYRKTFPFYQIRNLLQGGMSGKMAYLGDPMLAYRDHDTARRVRAVPDTASSTGIYLVYGQSNASNSGQRGYQVRGDVFQYFGQAVYRYQDPALGGNGGNGSVWGMLGDRLIDSGLHRQVVFSVTSLGGKTLQQLSEGEYLDYFLRCHRELIQRFGRIDGVLFHQGEYNHQRRKGHTDYYETFLKFLEKMRSEGVSAPVYLCQTSFCDQGVDYGVDTELLSIQDSLIRSVEGIRRGPNTDLLISPEYRLPDRCHFSLEGYGRFADQWLECLRVPSEN